MLPHVARSMREAYGAFDLCHASVKKCPVAHTHTTHNTHSLLANIDRSQRYVELVNCATGQLGTLLSCTAHNWLSWLLSRGQRTFQVGFQFAAIFTDCVSSFLAEKPHKLPCRANKFAALFNAKCKFVTQKHG